MALSGAIDHFGDRVVWDFSYIGMAVTAFNLAVNALIVNCFVNIVIPSFAVFIDSTAVSVFMAHETVVFICSACRKTEKGKKEYSCHSQPCDDMLLNQAQCKAPFQLNGQEGSRPNRREGRLIATLWQFKPVDFACQA